MVVCWSRKGGVGTTVVAGAMAVALADRGERVLLVDLAGDLPVLFGAPPEPGRGVADWLAAGAAVGPGALGRLEEEVAPGVGLLRRGEGPLGPERAPALAEALAGVGRTVVVDGGRAESCPVAVAVAEAAPRRLLVARACPLALRPPGSLEPTGVVLVRDPGRALRVGRAGPVAHGAPVVAELALDPAVGRAVDLGLGRSRLPRSYAAVLRTAAGAAGAR
jgi:hypothetical protein